MYTTAQTVTLQASGGAIIRYTFSCVGARGGRFGSRFMGPIRVDDTDDAFVLGLIRDVRDGESVPPEGADCDLGVGSGSANSLYPAARLVLYRLGRDGDTTVTDLARYTSEGYGLWFGRSAGPFTVVPDDQGGLLAIWSACFVGQGPVNSDCHTYARHVQGATLGPVYELPHDPGGADALTGPDGAAFFGGPTTAPIKFNTATGAVPWTAALAGTPAALRSDGRVEIEGPTGRAILDPTGTVPLVSGVGRPIIETAGTSRVQVDGHVRSVIGDSFTPHPYAAFAVQTGGVTGRSATRPVYVDNTIGTSAVLVKPEKCELDFETVPAGRQYREELDGVKPPVWLTAGLAPSMQDWYKVNARLGVKMKPAGFASRTAACNSGFRVQP